MGIIEQIKALPDGDLQVTGRPIEPFFSTSISGAGIKALAESHRRLLQAAKSATAKGEGIADWSRPYQDLQKAVKEAEQLK